MSIAAPTVIVKGFATSGDKNVIPNAPSATPGLASYSLGYPPSTRIPKTSGGVPPRGLDENGVHYDSTSNIAWLTGGNGYAWSAAHVAENTGYAIGAVLRSTVDPWVRYYNRTANNANNPDSVLAGWTRFSLLTPQNESTTIVLAAGTTNNLAIPAGIGALDLNPTSGDATVTGIIPEFDGQELWVTNVHASNLVTLTALDAGSSAANQFRTVSSGITLIQYLPVLIKRFATINKWLVK